MNLNHFEAIQTVQKLAYLLTKDDYAAVDVSIHPPFTDIRSIQTILDADEMKLSLGSQHCHWEDKGAFTGEVSPAMLAKLNVSQRQVPIVVKFADDVRQSLDALGRLTVPGLKGPVMLSEVATLEQGGGPAVIRHGPLSYDQVGRSAYINEQMLDLSARDTLLPQSHWYLAQSHEQKGEHILAATSFTRLAESFPDDSLADDALFQAGSSYLRLWRNAELDPQYGTLAQAQFRTLLSVYPESPLRKEAESGLSRIDEQFAEKDYLNGLFYVRRGGFDSAISLRALRISARSACRSAPGCASANAVSAPPPWLQIQLMSAYCLARPVKISCTSERVVSVPHSMAEPGISACKLTQQFASVGCV